MKVTSYYLCIISNIEWYIVLPSWILLPYHIVWKPSCIIYDTGIWNNDNDRLQSLDVPSLPLLIQEFLLTLGVAVSVILSFVSASFKADSHVITSKCKW